MKTISIPIILLLLFIGCSKRSDDTTNIEGYKPIYISKETAFDIKPEGPAAFVRPGKMFLYSNYIFVTDKGLGVHIIDNSKPSNPAKIAFISIPGVEDATVKNGSLLANNITDLVSIDISDLSNIKYSSRAKNVFPYQNQLYPSFASGYFECADTTDNYVIGWEKAILKNPKCYR